MRNSKITLEIAIVVAAVIICSGIRSTSEAVFNRSNSSNLSGSVQVYTGDDDTQSYENREFLSQYAAALYLGISEESMQRMTEEGIFDGTYCIIDEEYIFSKEKLKNTFEGLMS